MPTAPLATPDARPHRPPARRRWGHRLFVAALVVALAFWILRGWLARRAGPDFAGLPGELVPDNAALVVRWPQAVRFVDRAARLKATRDLLGDSDLADLFLPATGDDASDAASSVTAAKRSATRSLAKRFVATCLGGEAVLAVLPPLGPDANADADAGQPASALLVVTKTNAGFDENLAELVAECYPELALETRVYRDCRLRRYNAAKTRRAFGYCRFGSTVALVLRSADWRRLEAVVDRRLGGEPLLAVAASAASDATSAPLALAPAGQVSAAKVWPGDRAPWLATPEPAPGEAPSSGCEAILYCEPRALGPALDALPSGESEKRKKGKVSEAPAPGWADLLAIWCPGTAYVTAHLSVDNGKQGLFLDTTWFGGASRSELPRDDAAAQSASASDTYSIDDYAQSFAATTPLCIAISSPELAARARATYERWAKPVFGKDLKDFESSWRKATEMRFERETLPTAGGFLGLAVTGMARNALLPLPQARVDLTLKPQAEGAAARAKAGADTVTGTALTVLGLVTGARDGGWLRLGINGPPNAPHVLSDRERLTDGPLLPRSPARPASAPPLTALALADLDAVTPMLEQVLAVMGLWSKDVRRDANDWQAAIDLLHHLHDVRLRVWQQDGDARADLLVPLE